VLGRSPLQISAILFLHFLFHPGKIYISIPSFYVGLFATRLCKVHKISNSEIIGIRAAYQATEQGDSPNLFFILLEKNICRSVRLSTTYGDV